MLPFKLKYKNSWLNKEKRSYPKAAKIYITIRHFQKEKLFLYSILTVLIFLYVIYKLTFAMYITYMHVYDMYLCGCM